MKATEIRGMCPYCYRMTNRAVEDNGADAPMHGDIGLCTACGELMMFDFTRRKNHLRKPTWAERAALEKHPVALAMRRAWYESHLQ